MINSESYNRDNKKTGFILQHRRDKKQQDDDWGIVSTPKEHEQQDDEKLGIKFVLFVNCKRKEIEKTCKV